jgi:hypothetical protein
MWRKELPMIIDHVLSILGHGHVRFSWLLAMSGFLGHGNVRFLMVVAMYWQLVASNINYDPSWWKLWLRWPAQSTHHHDYLLGHHWPCPRPKIFLIMTISWHPWSDLCQDSPANGHSTYINDNNDQNHDRKRPWLIVTSMLKAWVGRFTAARGYS